MRERQSWLQMRKMDPKVLHGRTRAAGLAARELAKEMDEQSDNRSSGGLGQAQPGSAQRRESIVARLRRFSPRSAGMVLWLVIAAPLAPASGQNLDAGKPASQIFAEVCANCHRSPREFRNNPGASFLREHYTTNSDMASTMAAYLSGAGDRGAGAPQPKRSPAAASAPAGGTAAARDAPAADTARDPRRASQSDPKSDAKTDAKADARTPPPSGVTRPRPGSAQTTAEVKPAAAPPAKPVLEEFEE
jgi:hypothetical protein